MSTTTRPILAGFNALLLAPLAALHAAVTSPPPASETHVQEIIVVCKTHFDIGYTHRVKDLLNYYRTTMIDRAEHHGPIEGSAGRAAVRLDGARLGDGQGARRLAGADARLAAGGWMPPLSRAGS